MAAPTADQILHIRRLAIGNSADTTTLPDADIEALWNDADGGNGDIYLTAAASADMLASAAASAFVWSADGQSVNQTMRQQQYRNTAIMLRARSSASGYGSGTMVMGRHEDLGDDDTEYAPD